MTSTAHPPRPAPRRLRRLSLAAATAALLTAWFISTASAAPQAETQLPETGWTASASTNSAAADAPAHAIDGNTGTRYSSDAVQAPGMWFQINLGSSQSFNQIQLNSGSWPGDYAVGYNVEVSTNGSSFTSVATGSGSSSIETITFAAQTAQYIRVVLTASSSGPWWSIAEFTAYTNGSTGGGGGTPPPTGGSLGPNVYVFTPSMSQASIQSTINTIDNQQAYNQFGTQRDALLFAPGTYGSAANPLTIPVGYYTSIAGLGQNPNQVTINGTIDAYNQCDGSQSNCNATTNFWRSISNLTLNVSGLTGCFNGVDVFAVSQAAPIRRVHVNGNFTLMDYCDGSPDYASGGFIAD
ncbi:MAG TPA: discoidin domain-containing protein, partial [Pseudonocardiaceae bacterium]